jgi:2-dehydro-3-deoxyphosphooctonate aldolase (KDO 8-P synthase)
MKINNITIEKDKELFLIAGPCVIESESSALEHAKILKEIAKKTDIPFIYKSSYDKANRTSIKSFRGPGLERGLQILAKVKEKFDIPLISDVHMPSQVEAASEVLDVIQIPALLSRQTDLIVEAAKTNLPVNIKKGQFLSPYDMKHVIEKAESSGNSNILITERGTFFGYNNLVADLRSISIMKKFGYPVIFDVSHSVQMPGAAKNKSSGKREFIPPLARAAVAAGCDGLFVETHINPDQALCDGPNMLRLNELEKLIIQIKKINKIVRGS